MSEWVPFEKFDPVRDKSYFVTLKTRPDVVECVRGAELIGANNVLAAMEVEMPTPYVPPKPKRIVRWIVQHDTGENWYRLPQLDGRDKLIKQIHMREALPGDCDPDVVQEVVAEMRACWCRADKHTVGKWLDRLEGKP